MANSRASEDLTIDRNSLCYKIFSNYLSNKDYEADKIDLVNLVNELHIDTKKAPALFFELLEYIAAAYIKTWTGWQFQDDFVKGKFTQEHYYNRFRKNLVHKIGLSARTQLHAALSSLPSYVVDGLVHNKFDTDKTQKLRLELHMKCPPAMLNTMVFDSDGDDIILKHHLEAPWKPLKIGQLINFPHINVIFMSPQISFIRKESSEYTRCLTLGKPPIGRNRLQNAVINTETAQPLIRRTCYSLEFLQEFIKQYLDYLSNCGYLADEEQRIEEIRVLLVAFLEDIITMDVNKTIATNTNILFQLTGAPLIRNKKLNKASGKPVAFYEEISPRASLLLLHVDAVQVPTLDGSIKFEAIEKLKLQLDKPTLPQISYECTFCHMAGMNTAKVAHHLEMEHKMGQPVRCTLCRNSISFSDVLTYQWKHNCQPKNVDTA